MVDWSTPATTTSPPTIRFDVGEPDIPKDMYWLISAIDGFKQKITLKKITNFRCHILDENIITHTKKEDAINKSSWKKKKHSSPFELGNSNDMMIKYR